MKKVKTRKAIIWTDETTGQERTELGGSSFQIVPNSEAKPLKATKIYYDPITRKKFEGIGVIGSVIKEDDDFILACLEFVEYPDVIHTRKIYRK